MSNAENRKTMDNTLNAEDKNSMIRSMLKDAAILFAITLIAGLILGAVYQLTKEPIAAQEEKAKTEARQEVFADAVSFTDAENFDTQAAQTVLDAGGFTGCSIDEYAAACDADGNLLGYGRHLKRYVHSLHLGDGRPGHAGRRGSGSPVRGKEGGQLRLYEERRFG